MKPGGFEIHRDRCVCKRCGFVIAGSDFFAGGRMAGHLVACVWANMPPVDEADALAMFGFGLEDYIRAAGVAEEYGRGYAAAFFDSFPAPAPPRVVH